MMSPATPRADHLRNAAIYSAKSPAHRAQARRLSKLVQHPTERRKRAVLDLDPLLAAAGTVSTEGEKRQASRTKAGSFG
jgi:hypothetical protein